MKLAVLILMVLSPLVWLAYIIFNFVVIFPLAILLTVVEGIKDCGKEVASIQRDIAFMSKCYDKWLKMLLENKSNPPKEQE